jgi:hypothetical protein
MNDNVAHKLLNYILCSLGLLLVVSNACSDEVTSRYFGLHIHKAEELLNWPHVRFGSWRLWDAHVQWVDLERRKDIWSFEKLDKYVDQAKEKNIDLLLPLGLTPIWASSKPDEKSAYGRGTAAMPTKMEYWDKYVRTVSERYKSRIQYYEIWNEPNDKLFFSGSVRNLVRLTCNAYSILKEVDPNIKVVSPAYTHPRNISMLNEFLRNGGKDCIDIVSYHLYLPSKTPNDLPQLINGIKDVMAKNGIQHMPLWNTESGWLIESTEENVSANAPQYWAILNASNTAEYISKSLILAAANGVERYFLYAWDSKKFGLLELTNKKLKEGSIAYDITYNWLVGKESPACQIDSEIWICKMSDDGMQKELILWSVHGLKEYSMLENWNVERSERADGKVISSAIRSDRILIDKIPIYLKIVKNG